MSRHPPYALYSRRKVVTLYVRQSFCETKYTITRYFYLARLLLDTEIVTFFLSYCVACMQLSKFVVVCWYG